MLLRYFAYDVNEECEKCTFGKQVITGDYAVYIICFMPHDKRFEKDVCRYFTLREQVKKEKVIL